LEQVERGRLKLVGAGKIVCRRRRRRRRRRPRCCTCKARFSLVVARFVRSCACAYTLVGEFGISADQETLGLAWNLLAEISDRARSIRCSHTFEACQDHSVQGPLAQSETPRSETFGDVTLELGV